MNINCKFCDNEMLSYKLNNGVFEYQCKNCIYEYEYVISPLHGIVSESCSIDSYDIYIDFLANRHVVDVERAHWDWGEAIRVSYPVANPNYTKETFAEVLKKHLKLKSIS